jgi:hypothetical protein
MASRRLVYILRVRDQNVFSIPKTNKRYDFARRGEVPDDHMKLWTGDGPGHIIFRRVENALGAQPFYYM